MVALSSTFGNLTSSVVDVMSKQKPAVLGFNSKNQSRNRYNNYHIRIFPRSKEMVFSASTRVKIIKAVDKMTQQSFENTTNNMFMDDYSNREMDGIEVFVKALEHEGVTHINLFMLNRYVVELNNAVFRSKVIHLNHFTDETFTYYTATGFAVADQGHRDQPGVCCISADSALLVNDVLVKCGRGPVVFILVPFDKENKTCSLCFNNDALMSLPHYYHALDVGDVSTIVKQAFSFAYNEPGGPVFIDIQHLLLDRVDHEEEDDVRTEAEILVDDLKELCSSVILYMSSSLDDGIEKQNKELSRFMELTGIQVTRSVVGLEEAVLVLYVGATCNDLPEIVMVNEHKIVRLIDVGDIEEMQKFIKPQGKRTTFPTFKEINEILVAEGIRFGDDFSCWGRLFLEMQKQSEYVLASCYADIISTSAANNDKRITQEFANRVLDEFVEENKEKVMVYRGDNDMMFFKNGAHIAEQGKDVYVVIDGFEKGKVVNDYFLECVILDNSGWTKRFYQETRKLSVEIYKKLKKLGVNDDRIKERVVGKVVTDKCDLKNALYQYHESPALYNNLLVVAVMPPPDRFIEEEIPNFSRDLRFYHYPSCYVWNLVDSISASRLAS